MQMSMEDLQSEWHASSNGSEAPKRDSMRSTRSRMSATQRAALAFRTRTIADLSTPEPGNWKPSGNGQRQTDVTVWERALPRPTMSAAPTSLTEASTKFHEPTSQFRAAHYWPAAASSGGNFNPGDHRRRATDVTRAGLK